MAVIARQRLQPIDCVEPLNVELGVPQRPFPYPLLRFTALSGIISHIRLANSQYSDQLGYRFSI